MADDRCRDCERPIRMVRLGTSGNDARFPVDFTPSPEGQYVILGPDTAAYVKEDRQRFAGALYTDHRRTCPSNKATGARPLFPRIGLTCFACEIEKKLVDDESAKEIAAQFVSDHMGCWRKTA